METTLVTFKNKKVKSPFAPKWNYHLIESFIDDVDFVNLTNLILNRESEIIQNTQEEYENQNEFIYRDPFDGYTGLGSNSLTSRSNLYNLLTWNDPDIDKIKNNILKIHDIFLKRLGYRSRKKLYIQCWANVLRKGEQIKPHIHSIGPDCYLGGHITVKTTKTSTYYMNPVDQINFPQVHQSENKSGKITLFQNCLPHYTDVYNGSTERISIAFDLSLYPIDNKTMLRIR